MQDSPIPEILTYENLTILSEASIWWVLLLKDIIKCCTSIILALRRLRHHWEFTFKTSLYYIARWYTVSTQCGYGGERKKSSKIIKSGIIRREWDRTDKGAPIHPFIDWSIDPSIHPSSFMLCTVTLLKLLIQDMCSNGMCMCVILVHTALFMNVSVTGF